ncbi:MAG: hypothetical protein U0236_21790 [Nitrospira sp.]
MGGGKGISNRKLEQLRQCVGCSRFLCPSAKLIVGVGSLEVENGTPQITIDDPKYSSDELTYSNKKRFKGPTIANVLKQALRKKVIVPGRGMFIFELSKKIDIGEHAALSDLTAVAFHAFSKKRSNPSTSAISKQNLSARNTELKRLEAAVQKSWSKHVLLNK